MSTRTDRARGMYVQTGNDDERGSVQNNGKNQYLVNPSGSGVNLSLGVLDQNGKQVKRHSISY